jgi:two-component system, OmpR family, sensor histidine kinase MtrB
MVPVAEVRKRRPWWLGLRARITVAFALLGLIVSVALAVIAFLFARQQLVDNNDSTAVNVGSTQARTVRDELRKGTVTADDIVTNTVKPTLKEGVFVAVYDGREWVPSASDFDINRMPPELISSLLKGQSGRQRFRIGSVNYIVVGIVLPETPAQAEVVSLGIPAVSAIHDVRYLQGFPLTDVQDTLRLLTTSLVLAALIAAVAAAMLGLWAGRRVLSPLSRVADAAGKLASGTLDTRLGDETDPALKRLAESFNDMANTVQDRIEREQRFASDVSHELRTPLQTLIGSIEVLQARRADLPERSQQALDLISSQTKRFHQMVLDLLEISRLDAGVADLHLEPVQLDQFVNRVAGHYGYASVPVITESTWQQQMVTIDRRRLERALANLLGNAENYAGGPVRITLDSGRSPGGRQVVRIGVEDAGPGVPNSDKLRIFERFARGAAARHRSGTGLGLALVHDYVHLQGGRVWIEDRAAGPGARFVIELPAEVDA